ncbi:hypothetical protein ACQPW1_00460 [Nocardia sp. CA-128927]|uniref:hypothetical protein n=1 Tax=Nocardia sp. CA-128927 TaxID=3239975 RepID=UPI003D986376
MSRFHQLRYTDRWRFDARGRRLLTLREIWVRIQILPNDSALVVKGSGGPRWSVTDYLLADVYRALTGRAHDARPKTRTQQQLTAQRLRAERAVHRRFAKRRRANGSGEGVTE